MSEPITFEVRIGRRLSSLRVVAGLSCALGEGGVETGAQLSQHSERECLCESTNSFPGTVS